MTPLVTIPLVPPVPCGARSGANFHEKLPGDYSATTDNNGIEAQVMPDNPPGQLGAAITEGLPFAGTDGPSP